MLSLRLRSASSLVEYGHYWIQVDFFERPSGIKIVEIVSDQQRLIGGKLFRRTARSIDTFTVLVQPEIDLYRRDAVVVSRPLRVSTAASVCTPHVSIIDRSMMLTKGLSWSSSL
jgi:hypothetical protein